MVFRKLKKALQQGNTGTFILTKYIIAIVIVIIASLFLAISKMSIGIASVIFRVTYRMTGIPEEASSIDKAYAFIVADLLEENSK